MRARSKKPLQSYFRMTAPKWHGEKRLCQICGKEIRWNYSGLCGSCNAFIQIKQREEQRGWKIRID